MHGPPLLVVLKRLYCLLTCFVSFQDCWIVFREEEQFAVLISIRTLALGSQVFAIVGWLIAVSVCVCVCVCVYLASLKLPVINCVPCWSQWV